MAVASERTIMARAYGALWRDLSPSTPCSRSARELLRDSLSKAERREGVAWAISEFGPMSDREALSLDMRAGVFPEKSIPDTEEES